MPIFATDKARLSALIKNYDSPRSPELCNELVTVNEASATTYALGTVLGKITASGKYIVSKPAAADGSQTPVAIYIGDAFGFPGDSAIPAATDTKVLVLARGKVVVAASALVLDSTINTAPLRATAYAALKAVGILVETSV